MREWSGSNDTKMQGWKIHYIKNEKLRASNFSRRWAQRFWWWRRQNRTPVKAWDVIVRFRQHV